MQTKPHEKEEKKLSREPISKNWIFALMLTPEDVSDDRRENFIQISSFEIPNYLCFRGSYLLY